MLAGLVFLAASVSWWFTGRLANPSATLTQLDFPNARSLHDIPTPRTGGIGILAGFALGVAGGSLLGIVPALKDNAGFAGWSPLLWIIAMTFVMACVSFLDDRLGLPVWIRLGTQCAAAAVLVVGAQISIASIPIPFFGTVAFGSLSAVASLGFIVWMTNLYNFMDGMDGFAGGMTVVGGSAVAYFAWTQHSDVLVVLALLLGGAAAGFLVHNFPPAKIFLGDVGSVPIGFIFGALMLLGVRDRVFDLWVPVIVFSPFILDATVTLLRRVVRGEKVWEAHRSHFYQRAVLLGWGHRRTVVGEYVLMLVCAGLAGAYQHGTETRRLVVLAVWSVLIAGLMGLVTLAEQGRNRREVVTG